jgi:uncharacterized membrane protein
MTLTSKQTGRISVPGNHGIKVECSIRIHRPTAEVFAFWADFRNLPRFMVNLHAVTALENGITRWEAYDPMRNLWTWEAETINWHENELIAWRTLPGTKVPNAGSVRFHPIEDETWTEVTLKLEYDPPTGALTPFFLAMLLLPDPEREVQESLQRLKALLESKAS